MLEIHVNVTCPDLVLAATALAKLLRPGEAETPSAPAPAAVPASAPVAMPTVPTSAPTFTPPAPPVPPVPLAAAPQYTMEQIARAGAELVTRDPSKAPAAGQLLASFGIQSVSALPVERFGEFVTALRGLGASI